MYGRIPQQINQLQNAAMMAHQQQLSQMQGGLGGLGGGLSDQVFEPLKNMLGQHLTQSVVQEKVEPFVEEVKQMAQKRFDLGGGTSSTGGVYGGRLGGGTPRIGTYQVQPYQGIQAQPANPSGMTIPQIGQVNRAVFQRAFGGFADGGPVDKGLGSFLASNIDEFGRNGDTEVIHATKSEVVLPKGMVDNPEVRQTVRDLFEQTGRDMQEYTVGSGEMNVNPMTGYEEAFDLIGGIKDIFKKAAPVLLPIATTFMFPGMSPFLSGALAGGVGSLIQGGSMEDAFKAGIQGGLVSSATNALFNPGQRNPFKPVDPGVDKAFTPRDVNMSDLAGKAQTAGGTVKDFFMNPKLTADQVAQQAGFESLAAAPETSRAVLTQAAVNSGGLNTGRAIAGGLGALALAGGFDELPADDVEDPYPYSSRELMEMYPERYRTGPIIAPRKKTREEEDPVYMRYAAKGGEMDLKNDPRMQKDRMTFPRRQGYIAGPGTETSDDIPAMLSDGEFVMTARAVRGAGDGSRKEGVKKMYDIMRAFEGGVVS